jgi:hypothetical protein
VELCNSVEDAAAHVGLNRATVFTWLAKGREDGAAGLSTPYRDFVDAIDTAKSRRRLNITSQMQLHGKKNWQALAWLAERTDAPMFGLRIRVQVNEELERMMDRLARQLTPQEYERVLQAVSAADDSSAPTDGAAPATGTDGRGLSAAVGAAVDAALSGADTSS